MLSIRDVTQEHQLQRSKEDFESLTKLHMTISKDLVDPLTLILVCVKWLIVWYS